MDAVIAAAIKRHGSFAPANVDAPTIDLKGPGWAFAKSWRIADTPFKDVAVIWLGGFLGAMEIVVVTKNGQIIPGIDAALREAWWLDYCRTESKRQSCDRFV